MSTSYTIIIAAKRVTPFKNCPELWDIIHRQEFKHPKLMRKYLNSMGILFGGFKPPTNTKVELYESRSRRFDTSKQPMIIRSHMLPGKTTYRPCVFFPNGNVQDLRTFFNHWEDMLVAMGEECSPTKIARLRERAA